jgi:hypothetical protein
MFEIDNSVCFNLAKKTTQFCSAGFITLLVFLIFPLPVLGNQFYNSLPDPKRTEIKIIDDQTVEVGIGPDNRSVSCNILDAVQSIPYVGAGGEPDTVFVNKEMVYHFRKGLYTWDRAGKYRVRLTTKYMREFGRIRIHVPKEGVVIPEDQKEPVRNATSVFHQSLSQNIKEEITIIDKNMVEVAIGPDDRSVSANILHAVKSIPSLKEDMTPDSLLVNNKPIYRVKEGVYSWDREGRNPVRLTTKYIRKFGNIQVHIVGEEPPFTPKVEPVPMIRQEQASLTEPEKQVKETPIEEPKGILAHESIVAPPVIKNEQFVSLDSLSPQKPERMRSGVVKGFRLAQFGMNEERLIKTIQADFGQPENKIEKRRVPATGQKVLTIISPTLDPDNGNAWIHYYLSSRNQTLSRVDVIWGHPDHSEVDHTILEKTAERFKNLIRQLTIQSVTSEVDNEPYIFYGEDILGNGIKLMWDKPYDKAFQAISKSEPTLILSYFQHLQ